MFRCFRTEIGDDGFQYSYKLYEEISNDSLGIDVIRKEGILELIDREQIFPE